MWSDRGKVGKTSTQNFPPIWTSKNLNSCPSIDNQCISLGKSKEHEKSLHWSEYQGALFVAIFVSEPIMDMPGKLTRWLTGWAIGHGCGGLSFNWKPRITFQITTFRKNILIAYLLSSVHLSICKVLRLVNGESGGSHQGKEGCCYRHHQCHSPYCNTREKVWKWKEKRKWKQKRKWKKVPLPPSSMPLPLL